MMQDYKTQCERCGSRLIFDRIDYKREVLGQEVIIPNVEGTICTGCGHQKPSEFIEQALNTKVLEERLKLHKEMPKFPILINKVKRVRERASLSQKQLGETLGITEQRFGAIERNVNTTSVFSAMLLGNILDVDVNELYEIIYIDKSKQEMLRDMKLEKDEGEYKLIPIEGLKEMREKLDAKTDEIEEVRNEINALAKSTKMAKKTMQINDNLNIKEALQNSIKSNDQEKKKLEKVMNGLKKEKDDILKNFYELEKKSVLKQGYCLDYFDYIKIKDIVGGKLREEK